MAAIIEHMKAKVDEMHAWFDDTAPPAPTDFTRSAASMHFYCGLVVIEKDDVPPSELLSAGGGRMASIPADEIYRTWARAQPERDA